MNTCDICFADTSNTERGDHGYLECTRCRDDRNYYFSLTPSELRAEHESVARHVEDQERRECAEGTTA